MFSCEFPLRVIFPCWIFPDGLFQLSILTLCFMAALLLEPVGGAQNFVRVGTQPWSQADSDAGTEFRVESLP